MQNLAYGASFHAGGQTGRAGGHSRNREDLCYAPCLRHVFGTPNRCDCFAHLTVRQKRKRDGSWLC